MKNQVKVTINNNYTSESKSEKSSSEFILTLPLSDGNELIIHSDSDINTDIGSITKSLAELFSSGNLYNKPAQLYSHLESSVTKIINEFGIPAHTKGYRYLRDAIVLVTENPEVLESVTKEIYPAVAKRNNTTPVRVERVIRHAIESCFTRGNADTVYSYFPHCLTNIKGKPTNSEFIAALSNKIRMQ